MNNHRNSIQDRVKIQGRLEFQRVHGECHLIFMELYFTLPHKRSFLRYFWTDLFQVHLIKHRIFIIWSFTFQMDCQVISVLVKFFEKIYSSNIVGLLNKKDKQAKTMTMTR